MIVYKLLVILNIQNLRQWSSWVGKEESFVLETFSKKHTSLDVLSNRENSKDMCFKELDASANFFAKIEGFSFPLSHSPPDCSCSAKQYLLNYLPTPHLHTKMAIIRQASGKQTVESRVSKLIVRRKMKPRVSKSEFKVPGANLHITTNSIQV